MRDLAENLGILVSHRPLSRSAGIYNTRANGAHNTAGEIDLADYNYPRKILVIVTIGELDQEMELDVNILSGSITGTILTPEAVMPTMTAVGEWIYELETTQRFLNIRCRVTNIPGGFLNYAVVLVTDHARYGNMGSDD